MAEESVQGPLQGLTLDQKTVEVLVAHIIPTSKYFESRFDHLQYQVNEIKEDIKNLETRMGQRFEQVDKRFEQVDAQFVAVRGEISGLEGRMGQRFEQVDKRFEQVDKRFEQVDKRLDLMKADMDKRFEQVDKRFDEMLKRHDTHFMWLVGLIGSGVMIVIGAMRYL
jgi:uncharacterized protein (DUF3084 family)